MPIIGLTDKKSIMPRFPVLGKLRKGGEKQNGRFGKDLDYFRFTSERQDVAEIFVELYGETTKMFRVYLPFSTPNENFGTWKELWGSGRTLKHRCDGIKVVREYKENQYYNYDHLPVEQRPDCPGGCKEVGRLTAILPELWKQGFIGYVTLETHSLHDLQTIMASLHEAYQSRQEHGLDLRAMEFTLRRIHKTVSTPMDNKRAETTKSLIQIEPSVNWARLQITASQQAEQRMLRTAQENEIIFEDRHQEKETDLESSEMEVVETETPLDPKLVERFKALTEEKIQQKILKPKKRQEARTLLETRQYTNNGKVQPVTDELLKTFIQKLEHLKPKPTKSDPQKDTGILAEITSLANQILDYMQVHEKALQDAPKCAETLKNLEGYVEAVKDGTDEFEPMSLVDRRKTLEGTLTTLKEIIVEKKQQ